MAAHMHIIRIDPDSLAEELGLQVGDKLISVNGHPIEDKLDFQFYAAAEDLVIVTKRGDEEIIYECERDFNEPIGIGLEPMKFRTCGNNCVFCFVYQNPDGMRPSLYVKDEDYRLSFLYGNYTTLTNARQKDLDKIVAQRLSPQYVSVHATDESVRMRLLGVKKADNLLEKLRFLTDHGIEIHGQIVLCPELNDGDILHESIETLLQFRPHFKSVAIVPLGLTRYREGLVQLRNPDADYARRFIDEVNLIREKLKRRFGDSFVFLGDEWYLKAGIEIPGDAYYEDFDQVENGVGVSRDFINQVTDQHPELPDVLPERKRLTLVTSKLPVPILRDHLLPVMNGIENLDCELIPIHNDFYGENITVAGLLTAKDIYAQLKDRDLGDLVVLPPRVLNPDGVFLDNWTVEQLEAELDCSVMVYNHHLRDITDTLTGVTATHA